MERTDDTDRVPEKTPTPVDTAAGRSEIIRDSGMSAGHRDRWSGH